MKPSRIAALLLAFSIATAPFISFIGHAAIHLMTSDHQSYRLKIETDRQSQDKKIAGRQFLKIVQVSIGNRYKGEVEEVKSKFLQIRQILSWGIIGAFVLFQMYKKIFAQ